MKRLIWISGILISSNLYSQHNVENQSVLYLDNSNLGINITNPISLIDGDGSFGNTHSDHLINLKSNSNVRSYITALGAQKWFLASTAAEAGAITFATPGGKPGIVIWTGINGDENRFDLSNQENYFSFGYNGTAPTAINITKNGKIGIGTTNPAKELSVNGFMESEEIQVKQDVADYVFEEDYNLISLDSLESYIKLNGNLPNIQNRNDVKSNKGYVKIGELSISLMEKLEELTIHLIELNKRVLLLEEANITKKKDIKGK